MKQITPSTSNGRRKRLDEADVAFATDALKNVERLIEEAVAVSDRMEALEPRFKAAALQKARTVVVAYAVVAFILLFSLAWNGSNVIFVQIAAVGFLIGMHFVPVHFFVDGNLRSDARLMRKLDNERLARAKEAAKLGQATSQELKDRLGMEK